MGNQTIQGHTNYMRDVYEAVIIRNPDFFQLMHSSSKSHYRLPEEHLETGDSDSRQHFIKTYKIYKDGKPIDNKEYNVKIEYDYRIGKAIATQDEAASRLIEHLTKNDLDMEKIDKYINKWIEEHKPTRPWRQYV
jgi:hypothetical protein